MYKKFSLNHDAIGTRTSGSFRRPDDWIETEDDNGGDYWAEKAGMTLGKWKAGANIGDRYYVATSVYIARVD